MRRDFLGPGPILKSLQAVVDVFGAVVSFPAGFATVRRNPYTFRAKQYRFAPEKIFSPPRGCKELCVNGFC